ncbi:unnamed protein product [Ectocarpus sp. 13 AM-2016]
MGNLMGLLWRDGHAGYEINLSPLVDEGKASERGQEQPKGSPQNSQELQDGELHLQLCLVVERCSDAIQLVQQYEGCSALIRQQSMSAPEDTELQSAVTKALLPNIQKIKTFFDLARDVEQLTPALLRRLAGLGSIVEAPLLACMLTELLQAVLEWDQLKMMRPQIQNDFATYRRYFSRLKREQEAGLLSELPVADTDANVISMFIAEAIALKPFSVTARSFPTSANVPSLRTTHCSTAVPQCNRYVVASRSLLMYLLYVRLLFFGHVFCTWAGLVCVQNVPMMVMLSKVTAKTAEEVPRVQNIIAIVANMCCGMVHRRAYTNDATSRKLLMAMTSAAVLYDRITDSGVFVRRSHIGVSKCIKVLNKHGGATGEQLRATLRYSTMHYNSDTTPKNIRNALAR